MKLGAKYVTEHSQKKKITKKNDVEKMSKVFFKIPKYIFLNTFSTNSHLFWNQPLLEGGRGEGRVKSAGYFLGQTL